MSGAASRASFSLVLLALKEGNAETASSRKRLAASGHLQALTTRDKAGDPLMSRVASAVRGHIAHPIRSGTGTGSGQSVGCRLPLCNG